MAEIHPIAIIDEGAELAKSVQIGPGCVIRGRVQIDEGTRLIGHVYLQGPMTIGRDNVVYPQTCLGFAPQHREIDPGILGAGLRIGHENTLREGVTLHRATGDVPTTIGHRNYFMANSHVGHDCIVGSDCTFSNGSGIGGHVEVHDSALLGGNAMLHQFCRMGRLSLVSGLAGLSQDLPPFCVCYDMRTVGALNLIGLRRAGYRQHIEALKRAFDIVFRQGHSKPTAVAMIEDELSDDPLCMELAQFIQQSERGISPYGGHRKTENVCENGG